MPILPPEPDCFPPALWDDPAPEGAQWWCLHTKPRAEKATARFLRANKIPYYLPQMVQDSRTPAGRKITSLVPMFTSYIFLRGTDHDRVAAFRGDSLVNSLAIQDQNQLVADLGQIRRLLSSGVAIVPEPTHPVGSWVRVLSGPFVGMVGVVDRRGPKDRFIALVNFLGRGAAVEFQDWQVERVKPGDLGALD